MSGVRDTASDDYLSQDDLFVAYHAASKAGFAYVCLHCGGGLDANRQGQHTAGCTAVSASGGPMNGLAAMVLERMSQDSGPADCEPFTGWCVDLAREVLALRAVLTPHEQAARLLRELWKYTGRDQYYAGELGQDIQAFLAALEVLA